MNQHDIFSTELDRKILVRSGDDQESTFLF